MRIAGLPRISSSFQREKSQHYLPVTEAAVNKTRRRVGLSRQWSNKRVNSQRGSCTALPADLFLDTTICTAHCELPSLQTTIKHSRQLKAMEALCSITCSMLLPQAPRTSEFLAFSHSKNLVSPIRFALPHPCIHSPTV